jgi:hypothetical protein
MAGVDVRRGWAEMYEHDRVEGGIRQPRLYLLTIGRRK